MPIEYMKDAYGMLYQIENTLRLEITRIMKKEYGLNWMKRAPYENKYAPFKKDDLNTFHLYELIRMIYSYECIKNQINISEKEISRIPYIRNKIAHSKLINDSEYDLLKNVYSQFKKTNQFV